MAKPIVVTALSLPEAASRSLLEIADVRGPEQWERHLPDATALIALLTTRVDAALLDRAPGLRVVANAVVGHDNVDLEACRGRGVVVTNTPEVLTAATADLTWALLLATVRGLPAAERSLRAGSWQGWRFWEYLGADLDGRTLGVFGMGRIGRAVSARARGFGMKVRYTSRTGLSGSEEAAFHARRVSLEELVRGSDILSLHAPLTPETRHVINADRLAMMRPGSFLINTARGALVDEAALVDALRGGPLAGAGLDVYENEPELHPGLLELPNVVLLPHIGSATRGTRTRMATLAVRNVRAVLSGEPPLTPVLS